MPSIQRTHAAVVACHASAAALDSLPAMPNAFACRVARDELWLVAPPERLALTERCATEHFSGTDPSALVLDQTDGWTTFSLRGNEGLWIFAQLSAVPLPSERPAFVQGSVAGGSAKVLLLDGVVHVLVPSTLLHHPNDTPARGVWKRLHLFLGDAFLGDQTTLTSPIPLSTPALR